MSERPEDGYVRRKASSNGNGGGLKVFLAAILL
jgi:hypothetical protein